jgi:hypothetical protein
VVRGLVVFTFVAALAVFCIVQDRITAAGATQYAEQARAAIARNERPIPVDEVMRPAVDRSVRVGMTWAGIVLSGGLAAVLVIARSARE